MFTPSNKTKILLIMTFNIWKLYLLFYETHILFKTLIQLAHFFTTNILQNKNFILFKFHSIYLMKLSFCFEKMQLLFLFCNRHYIGLSVWKDFLLKAYDFISVFDFWHDYTLFNRNISQTTTLKMFFMNLCTYIWGKNDEFCAVFMGKLKHNFVHLNKNESI